MFRINNRSLLVALFAVLSLSAYAKKESNAQSFWPFRVSHRACEGFKGGFFSGAAGYVWGRMAFGAQRTLPGTLLTVGTGALTGFFGNWAQAKRLYEQKKQKIQKPALPVEHVSSMVGGAYTGGIIGNLAARYTAHTHKIQMPQLPRYGSLVGTGCSVLWNAAKMARE